MSYVSLYRKWRPQTFADVIGQDHVTGTLVNALATNQVHHAMLFAGTRGTGKTSTARILAKALNCQRGVTAEPDNTCDSCRAITDGTSLDVVEIDAASHGSVDDARDLREKASYAPASSRFKVYIIDEAHMVTTQGFNAMLKVLEEPPEHVRFVFATTEPHKVIEAIRSRCQQHDFRRVRTALLAEYFGKICDAEKVQIEPAALELVARAADGSVRDGLSRLDQVLTYASPRTHGDDSDADAEARRTVGLADVARVLGALPVELRFDLGDALATHRVADIFELAERVVEGGNDLTQFAKEALEHVRDLFVLRVAPDTPGLVDTTPETRARLVAQAERFGVGELGRLVRILGEVHLDMRTATDPRLVLEVGLARAALPESAVDPDALLARIERLERRLGIGGDGPGVVPSPPPDLPAARAAAPPTTARAAEPSERSARPARRPGTAATAVSPAADGDAGAAGAPAAEAAPPARAERPRGGQAAGRQGRRQPPRPSADAAAPTGDWAAPPEPPAAAELDFDLVRRSWPLLLERVRTASRVTAMYLEHGQPSGLDGRRILVEFPADARFHADALAKDGRQRTVEAVLTSMLGGDLTVRWVVGEGRSSAPEPSDVPPPADPTDPEEFAIDLAGDSGQELGSDADTRAVADLAAREFGGQVIDEQPNN